MTMRAIAVAALTIGLIGGLAACAPDYPVYPAGYPYRSAAPQRPHHRPAARAHRPAEGQEGQRIGSEWVNPPPEAAPPPVEAGPLPPPP